MSIKRSPASETQEILDAIRRIVRMLRISSRITEKEMGLSSAQLYVLQKLNETSGMSLNDLAKRTMTHQSSVSVVVAKLADRGLVVSKKSEEDARRVEISIASAGKRLIKRSRKSFQDKLISAIESLPKTRRSALARDLAKIASEAGTTSGPAPLFFEDKPV